MNPQGWPTPTDENDPAAPARASVVNRTHRVVRQQAQQMRSSRDQMRSLWLPVALCSSLLLVVLYAAWTMFDFYDVTPNGMPDASDQLMLVMLWCLPVTAVVLLLIWYRRARNGSEGTL